MASGWAGPRWARVALAVLMLGGALACANGASDVDDAGAPAASDDGSESRATTSSTVRPTTTVRRTTTTTVPRTTRLPPTLPAGDDATVTRIVDGDTLWVGGPGSGGETKIRLIGIDTPEVAQDECYAGEATAHLAALVGLGTRVRLVYDVERFDRFDRTLAYVFRLDDGLHANLAMAQDGYAQQLTVPPNVAHEVEFGAAVADARAAGRGLWGAGCVAPPEAARPLVPPAPVPAPAPAVPGSGAGCDASYLGVCIPPAPPDLDCPDIAPRRFPVVPPDPHGFDGNHDGVGCER